MKKKLSFKKAPSPVAKNEAGSESLPLAAEASPEAPPATSALPADAKGSAKKPPLKKGIQKPSRLASKAKPKAAPPKERAVRAPRGGIPFICSECYEEFFLPSTYAKETVSCPECLHVGKRPAEDFLRKVALHKSGERGALKMALSFAYMLIISTLFLLWLVTPYSVEMITSDLRGTLTPGLGGLVLVLVGLLAWAVIRYENNRWEIYF